MEPGSSFIGNPTDTTTNWKTEAFRYSSTHSLYVECIVRICLDSDSSQQCTLCSPSAKRRRRNADEIKTSEIAFIKSGAFVIIEEGKNFKFFCTRNNVLDHAFFFIRTFNKGFQG